MGRLAALAEVTVRSLCFYPGMTLLGLCGALHLEEAASDAVLVSGILAAILLLLAWAPSADPAGEASVEVAAEFSRGLWGPLSSLGGWLVETLAPALGEGFLAGLAALGVTTLLLLGILGGGVLVLPVILFLVAPSWLRLGLVLLPPLPLTGFFALVTWFLLRRSGASPPSLEALPESTTLEDGGSPCPSPPASPPSSP